MRCREFNTCPVQCQQSNFIIQLQCLHTNNASKDCIDATNYYYTHCNTTVLTVHNLILLCGFFVTCVFLMFCLSSLCSRLCKQEKSHSDNVIQAYTSDEYPTENEQTTTENEPASTENDDYLLPSYYEVMRI